MVRIYINFHFKRDEELLLFFLNNSLFGKEIRGAKLASQRYFDKDVNRLSLTESLILAAIQGREDIEIPTPIRNNSNLLWNNGALIILNKMKRESFISNTEYDKSLLELQAR